MPGLNDQAKNFIKQEVERLVNNLSSRDLLSVLNAWVDDQPKEQAYDNDISLTLQLLSKLTREQRDEINAELINGEWGDDVSTKWTELCRCLDKKQKPSEELIEALNIALPTCFDRLIRRIWCLQDHHDKEATVRYQLAGLYEILSGYIDLRQFGCSFVKDQAEIAGYAQSVFEEVCAKLSTAQYAKDEPPSPSERSEKRSLSALLLLKKVTTQARRIEEQLKPPRVGPEKPRPNLSIEIPPYVGEGSITSSGYKSSGWALGEESLALKKQYQALLDMLMEMADEYRDQREGEITNEELREHLIQIAPEIYLTLYREPMKPMQIRQVSFDLTQRFPSESGSDCLSEGEEYSPPSTICLVSPGEDRQSTICPQGEKIVQLSSFPISSEPGAYRLLVLTKVDGNREGQLKIYKMNARGEVQEEIASINRVVRFSKLNEKWADVVKVSDVGLCQLMRLHVASTIEIKSDIRLAAFPKQCVVPHDGSWHAMIDLETVQITLREGKSQIFKFTSKDLRLFALPGALLAITSFKKGKPPRTILINPKSEKPGIPLNDKDLIEKGIILNRVFTTGKDEALYCYGEKNSAKKIIKINDADEGSQAIDISGSIIDAKRLSSHQIALLFDSGKVVLINSHDHSKQEINLPEEVDAQCLSVASDSTLYAYYPDKNQFVLINSETGDQSLIKKDDASHVLFLPDGRIFWIASDGELSLYRQDMQYTSPGLGKK